MQDGSEKQIAFTSCTLSTTETNYARVETEALLLIFVVRKFHQFLFGQPFILVTDHMPLTAILGLKKGIPQLAAARMQRWALTAHGNEDGLS